MQLVAEQKPSAAPLVLGLHAEPWYPMENQTKNRNNPPAAPPDQLEALSRLTKKREDAACCPDHQGHAHAARVLQDPLGWDEDASSNDSANDDGDPPQQRDFLLQYHLLLRLPAVHGGQPAVRLPLQVAPIRHRHDGSFPHHATVSPECWQRAQPKSSQAFPSLSLFLRRLLSAGLLLRAGRALLCPAACQCSQHLHPHPAHGHCPIVGNQLSFRVDLYLSSCRTKLLQLNDDANSPGLHQPFEKPLALLSTFFFFSSQSVGACCTTDLSVVGGTKPSQETQPIELRTSPPAPPDTLPNFLEQLVCRNKSLPKHKACRSARGKEIKQDTSALGLIQLLFLSVLLVKVQHAGLNSSSCCSGSASAYLWAYENCLHLPKEHIQTPVSPCCLATHPNQTGENLGYFPSTVIFIQAAFLGCW